MEKFRIFIFDNKDVAQIEEEIKELFQPLKFDFEVLVASSYLEAKKMVFEKRFDLFSLSDFKDVDYFMSADGFIDMINHLNPNAIILFLFNDRGHFSKRYEQKRGLLSLYKDEHFCLPRKMFNEEGIIKLKNLLRSKGFFDIMVPYDRLTDPVCVYKRVEISERDVYFLVAKKIKRLGIKYSTPGHEVFIENKDLTKIKDVAQNIIRADRVNLQNEPYDNLLLSWSNWVFINL